jgi:hypothetical protein
VSAGHPSTVTVIRLVEVLQWIIWINLLNDFGLFTLHLVREPLRAVDGFALRSGGGSVYPQAHGCHAADA